MEINKFTHEATDFGPNDFLGFDAVDGDGFQTKKITTANALKEYVYTGTTTGDSLGEGLVELLVNGGQLVIPTNVTWGFSALLVSRAPGGDGYSNVYRIDSAVENFDGTVRLTRNWDATNPSYSTNGKFDPAKHKGAHPVITFIAGDESKTFGELTIDIDGTALRIRVAGVSSSTIKWSAKMRFVSIAD